MKKSRTCTQISSIDKFNSLSANGMPKMCFKKKNNENNENDTNQFRKLEDTQESYDESVKMMRARAAMTSER